MITPAAAQETVIQWTPVGLEIVVPDGWEVIAEFDKPFQFINDPYKLIIHTALDDSSTPEAELEKIRDLGLEGMAFEDIAEFPLLVGTQALRLDFISPGFSGFTIALRYREKIVVITAIVDADGLSTEAEAAMLEIVYSMSPLPLAPDSINYWTPAKLQIATPEGWQASNDDRNSSLTITNEPYEIVFYILPDNTSTPRAELEAFIESAGGGGVEFGEINEIELLGDEAFRFDFTSSFRSGFIIGFVYDDEIIVITAGVNADEMTDTDQAILDGIINDIQPFTPLQTPDIEVEGYDGSPKDVAAELVALGVIPDTGKEVMFTEAMVFAALNGVDFTYAYQGAGIVMGATISWQPVEGVDETLTMCSLITQSTVSSAVSLRDTDTLLITGFDSDSNVLVLEVNSDINQPVGPRRYETNIDIADLTHLLVVVNNGKLAAFVNGQLEVYDYPILTPDADQTIFAGYLLNDGCVMTDIWGYTFDAAGD